MGKLKQLSYQVITAITFIYLINMLFRAYRWKLIINQKYTLTFPVTFKALVYGYMLNQLFPAKMGEVARPEYLARKNKQSRSFLLGTVVTERIFDMVVISLFLGIAVLFSETRMNIVKSNSILVLLILVGLAGVFLLFYYLPALKKLTGYFPTKIESF